AKGKRAGSHAGRTALAVGVVKGGRTDAHHHVGLTTIGGEVCKQATIGTDENSEVLIVDGVAQEVGGGVGFCQRGGGPQEFGLHDLKDGVAGIYRGRFGVARIAGAGVYDRGEGEGQRDSAGGGPAQRGWRGGKQRYGSERGLPL